MRPILYLIWKEFLQVLNDKSMLLIIFIAPIIQLILLGYAIITDVKRIPVVVCDFDNSHSSRELISGFCYSGYFNVNYYERDPQKIIDLLDNSKATIAVVVPPEFSCDIRRHTPASIQILLDGQDSNSSLIAMGYANHIVQSYALNLLYERLLHQPQLVRNIHTINPEIRVWYNPNLIAQNYMVPGIVVILLTIVTMMLTAMGIVREKEIGTLEQLMVTPIKPYQLMIGKTVPFAILGLVEIVFALSIAKLWYDMPLVGNLALLAAFAIIFMFTTLGLGIFISTISKTQQQAMFLAWFMMVFALLMSGFLFPIENMPKILQYVTYINPVRYFMTVVRELFLKGSGLNYLWHQGMVMLAFSFIILTISSIRFQKRIK